MQDNTQYVVQQAPRQHPFSESTMVLVVVGVANHRCKVPVDRRATAEDEAGGNLDMSQCDQ